MRCTECGHDVTRLHKTRRFFCDPENRVARCMHRSLPCRARWPRHDRIRSRAGQEKICARLLTVEKTVIRFRPADASLQKRVRSITTTSRSTTKPSARTVSTVDAGNVSFAKMQTHSESKTRSASRRGFFVAGSTRSRCAESVPARLARRRFVAGPIPVMLFCTGL
jgi:hypothetical protein